jgi:sec-independent protein translocase protein TatC
MFFLAKVGIVSSAFLAQYRKHAIVIITILAAVITPTADAFTMTMVGVPLYALYEVSIIVTRRIDKERKEREEKEEKGEIEIDE